MTYLVARVAGTKWLLQNVTRAKVGIPYPYLYIPMSFSTCCCRLHQAEKEKKIDSDPRINDLGRAIEDDYATIRQNYGSFMPPGNWELR